MPRINREEFLRTLEGVSSGLAAKELVNQATCFVFRGGNVYTFNDEIACRAPVPTAITGAVPATRLLELLRRLSEDSLDLSVEGGVPPNPGELRLKGAGRRSGITMEAEVLLPIDSIETPDATTWRPIGPEVLDAIELAAQCAATESDAFYLKCLHFTPTHIEACDNYKAVRCRVVVPIDGPVLVNAAGGKHLVGCGMSEIAATRNWLHFRNPTGLCISCRLYREAYSVPMEQLVALQGIPARLPTGLVEAVEKATVFSEAGDDVGFDLKPGGVRIRTKSVDGWYEERQEVEYTGEPVSFLISAKLIKSCLSHGNDILICPNAVKVERPGFTFFTSSKKPE